MKLKPFLRSRAFNSRLGALFSARASKLGAPIFMFHRTLPKGAESFDEGMDTEVSLFESFVVWLKNHFRVVSLPVLADLAESGARLDAVCSITIDDGWVDTYEHTMPILQRHGLSATIFLPTDYIGTHRRFWQDALWHHIKELSKGDVGRDFHKAARARYPFWPSHREPKFSQVLAVLSTRAITEAEEVVDWIAIQCGSVAQTSPVFMNWDQVRKMQACGMLFGSHTNSHPLLTKVSIDQAVEEIESSKERLEAILGRPVDTFCYPAGAFNARLADVARAVGYRVAVTDQPRLVTRQDSRWTLPRVGVSSLTLREGNGFSANALQLQLARAGVRAYLHSARPTP